MLRSQVYAVSKKRRGVSTKTERASLRGFELLENQIRMYDSVCTAYLRQETAIMELWIMYKNMPVIQKYGITSHMLVELCYVFCVCVCLLFVFSRGKGRGFRCCIGSTPCTVWGFLRSVGMGGKGSSGVYGVKSMLLTGRSRSLLLSWMLSWG